MIVIGDIHATYKNKDDIIKSIENYVSKSIEQEIVFLGDFVYHFSYDRRVIVSLFDLFVKLYSLGKKIYVISGNHDWIKNTFVFEEGKALTKIINDTKIGSNKSDFTGELHFIDQPKEITIDGVPILFLPYNFNIDSNIYGETNEYLPNDIKDLSESTKKGENLSFKVNKIIYNYLEKLKQRGFNGKSYIFHHYYQEDFQYFNLKHGSISKKLLEKENLFLVSGHIHTPLIIKNWFCTGSFWNTSPIEKGQINFIFSLDIKNSSLVASSIHINNILEVNSFTEESIKEAYFEAMKRSKDMFINENNQFNINFIISENILDYSKLSVILVSNEIGYGDLDFSGNLSRIGEVRIRNKVLKGEGFEKISTDGKDLINSFSDWKSLLKEYIEKKYPEEKQELENILIDLSII